MTFQIWPWPCDLYDSSQVHFTVHYKQTFKIPRQTLVSFSYFSALTLNPWPWVIKTKGKLFPKAVLFIFSVYVQLTNMGQGSFDTFNDIFETQLRTKSVTLLYEGNSPEGCLSKDIEENVKVFLRLEVRHFRFCFIRKLTKIFAIRWKKV